MIKNQISKIASKNLQNQMDLAIKNKDLIKCAHISYDAFSSNDVAPLLGSFGHSVDMQFQKTQLNGTLVDEFSNQYPNILSPKFISQLNNDPNYKNFSNSNQQFTMLTEAMISHKLPIIFPEVVDSCKLVMGASIPQSNFVKFHTGQHNSDISFEKKLPSGNSLLLYSDLKRSSMIVIESRVKYYLTNPGSEKPIYSNLHITNDIENQYIVSHDLYDYLKQELQSTQNFYLLNRKFYTKKEYDAIDEAVNESIPLEKEFLISGKVYYYNKLLYNASKFLTSDEMCKLLGISKLI